MSSIKQLGLFAGLGTSEATPSSDVATKPANSDERYAVIHAGVSETTPGSKPLASEGSDPPRKRQAPASTSAPAEECYLSVQAVGRRYCWRMSDALLFEVARQEAGR